jgi:precorrin-2 dehydrogenase/sirohydrochlorin ferrochelatase
METYPVMMNMKDKVVVIIGGGQIDHRKLIGLLQAGAQITVISPLIHVEIEKLLTKNQITWKNKLFEPADLDDALLVVAATDDKRVNEQVALSARNNQLVNVVDNQQMSNFHVPAKLQRGDLTISVATGGSSPILAKIIRNELATIYDESYEEFLGFLAISREKIKHLNLNQKTKIQMLKRITDSTYRKSQNKQKEFLELIANHVNEK